MQCLLLNGILNAAFSREAARTISVLLENWIAKIEKYITTMGRKFHASCIQYWNWYGTEISMDDLGNVDLQDDHKNTFYLFPGRKRCRNGIVFDRNDKQQCTKKIRCR